MTADPVLSVITPTFNNQAVLQQCLESWKRFASGQPVEVLVIEDGCKDGTAEYLEDVSKTEWGQRHLRWFHEDDAHELVCTNRGFHEARGQLLMTWQDDMFVRAEWFVPELMRTFEAYPEIGLMSLSRGLYCPPQDEPLEEFEKLFTADTFPSTIGRAPLNWFCLQEVDAVIRPWVVRRECLDKVGLLDEAFRPTEYDELDLCFRIREAGWHTATHGFERLGAYEHLGQTTLGKTISDSYKQRVLRNHNLFYSRWNTTIRNHPERKFRRWPRRLNLRSGQWTLSRMVQVGLRRCLSGRIASLFQL